MTVALAVVLVALVVVLGVLVHTVRSLRRATDELVGAAIPLVAAMRSTVANANQQLDRVDALVGTAENISATMDSATDLAYRVFSDPVVKVLSLGAGASRVRRRLTRGR
jgi:uncharacterized protein YoxC